MATLKERLCIWRRQEKGPKAGRDSGCNGRRVDSGIFIAPVSNVSHRLLPGPQHFAEASEC